MAMSMSISNWFSRNDSKVVFILVLGFLVFRNLRVIFNAKIYGHDIDNLTPTTVTTKLSNTGSSTNSLNCRLKWDLEKKEHLINTWLEMELPILVSAIRHDRGEKRDNANNSSDSKHYKQTKDDIVYIIFTQRPGRQKFAVMDFNLIPWKCLYAKNTTEGQINVNGDLHQYQQQYDEELAAIAPHKNDDVILMCNYTMHNSTLELTGVSPTILPSQKNIDSKTPNDTVDVIENSTHEHSDRKDSHPNPFVYNLEAPLECDYLEEQETTKIHDKKKIGACLRFKGEYDRSHLPEWIEYHRIIGVEHFWVYMNEEWNMTGLFNRSYITYIPYDFNWINHVSHFPHHYNDYQPKISQEPAAWSCMFNARKYGYDWVITTDVDEYIRVLKTENATTDSALSPFQSFLKRFDFNQNEYSSFIMNSVPFGRNRWLQEPDFPSNHLLIDYVWRMKKNISEYSGDRFKQIYNPQHVWSIGVHFCWAADKKKNVELTKYGVFLQHYKLANIGVARKGQKIMVKDESQLMVDATLRDMYRLDIANALEKLKK